MLVLSRILNSQNARRTNHTAGNGKRKPARPDSAALLDLTDPCQEVRECDAESRARTAAQGTQEQFPRQVSAWLETTGMGLGLLRLHLDAGQFEEARTALACIQADFQLLRLGVEGERESLCPKPTALPREVEEEVDDSSCGG